MDDVEIILKYLTCKQIDFSLVEQCCKIINIFIYLDIKIDKIQ